MGLAHNLIGKSEGNVLMGIKFADKFQHIPVSTEDEAVAIASQYSEKFDVYISCAKFDSSGRRKQENAESVNSFWLDIDCGPKKAYPSKNDGLQALLQFCNSTGLPKPTHINDSGNGLHVFWTVDRSLSPDEWNQEAKILKDLTHAYGLKADDTRTSDIASVLRMPGTFNHKDLNNPKPVISKHAAEPLSAELFIQRIHEASKGLGHSKSEKLPPESRIVVTILEYMEKSEPRLHSGEWEICETDLGVVGYPSQSEADYAYLGECVREAIALDVAKEDIHGIVKQSWTQQTVPLTS